MNKFLSIILLCSLVATTHAATIVPSLDVQMQKQEVVNKKHALLQKKLALEAKKRATAEKLATIGANNQTASAQARANSTLSQTASSTTQNTIKNSTTTTTTTSVVSQNITTVAQSQQTTTSLSVPTTQSVVQNVDMNRVRSTWLSWYNTGRAAKGLGAYGYDSRLDSTAHDWNIVFAGSRGTNFHERTSGDGYYNYAVINKWFQARGINPPVISGVTHSENVSYGYYACSKSDCTDDLVNAIRSSYIFFINSPVHAKSVYQPNFTKIGFDIIVVPNENRYYITVHFMTK